VYVLLDANVAAANYLPRSMRSKKAGKRIRNMFDSVRSGATEHFFYMPNFCIAEVFSVFMKYTFGKWNRHVDNALDTRVYNSLVKQFQSDIHNAKLIYHYELSRYHVLAINLVAPIDHYYQISRSSRRNRRKNVIPMGTFDHLVIAMGIHLAHIHGPDKVVVVTCDDRLNNVLRKCRSGIPKETMKKLKLDKAKDLTGIEFKPSIFPACVNLKYATNNSIKDTFGACPLPIDEKELKRMKAYRCSK